MRGVSGNPQSRRILRRMGWIVGGIAVFAVGLYFCRGMFVHRATAQQSVPSPSASASGGSASTGSPSNTDYTSRVVAYIHQSEAVTRAELGEYLIQRHGAEKLPLLLNKRIVDRACKVRGIVVTAAEIEAALAQELKGLAIDQNTFIKTVLARAKKNLYEWKEDVLRPRLQMTRLVQDRLTVSEEDLRKAYESAYGEKVECRIIVWPLEQEKQAMEEYAMLRDSEQAFTQKAKTQANSSLASTGGKIKPIARYSMDENVEREAFKLQARQVSTLIRTPQGIVLLRCDRRIPADSAVNMLAVKEKLDREIRERKLQQEMAAAFQAMRAEARPQPLLKKADRVPPGPPPAPSQVVAYINGNEEVSREELGEYLIARYGADKVEYLVNRRIIDRACKERNITVSDEEVDRALQADLAMLQCDQKHFERDLLGKWGKNLLEWREDVLRPKLLLTKMCEGRVKCTDEDLRKGFEAYYGEKLDCRLILWPPDQAKFAMTEYSRIRDSEEEFDRKARSQPSPTLAAKGGRVPPIGRHTLGNDDLEREAFKLQAGEVSTLIGTPQGQVVIRCDRRIPADTSVKLEQVRDRLTKEVLEKKVQAEMLVVFKELKDKATPRLMLRGTGMPEDLAAETKKLMSGLPPLPGGAPGK